MKKKWIKAEEREKELTKTEVKFEKNLSKDGFEIVGVREYINRTDYLLRKNGVEFEWGVSCEVSDFTMFYKSFLSGYEIKAELEALRKQTETN